MPCLNEAETLAMRIDKEQACLQRSGVCGEVVIADNGSTDGSIEVAQQHGARVVRVPVRGYGATLSHGIVNAPGKYVMLGDSDDSYDFSKLDPFVAKLREGNDLVMGNRFKGGGVWRHAFPAQVCGQPSAEFHWPTFLLDSGARLPL